MMMMTTATTSASASQMASGHLTDCSSMQGSSTSSASSDVMTLTTTAASSWCAIPASSRLRVLRLVRPHQRRLLVVPEHNATFGFAVRGGKEHGTGFFVSHVEHGGEAQLKGLRIGDQILRINGFRLDDAVHKEFIQLVASQDRVTLKVRGVGMLPVKDQPEERLSWSVVKLGSVSGTPSESSFKTERRTASRDISVVLHVAPRTKLGLGICKGPEWKPGIFVQFTKERSVAREAGLRPGDQILSVNSIDFSDVLFSEAVAVMKSSSKLDMVVRTAAGCDLFPGESSGYNSSASSVTGDQSPCWADAKSKRLTAVHEEPTHTGSSRHWAASNNNNNNSNNKGVEVHKQMNKTIIKLSENGTSINNTYIASSKANSIVEQSAPSSRSGGPTKCHQQKLGAPPPAPPPAINSNSNSNAASIAQVSPKQRTTIAGVATNNSTGSERISNGPIGGGGGGGGGGGDQHSALMDEFKRAHQRMFRNGFHESEHKVSSQQLLHLKLQHFNSNGSNNNNKNNLSNGHEMPTMRPVTIGRPLVTMSTYEERGETLKRTSIMPDDTCYRNSTNNGNTNNNNASNNRISLMNGGNSNNNNTNAIEIGNGINGSNINGTPELPPPPPQFANPQQSLYKQLPTQQQQQKQLQLKLNGNIAAASNTPTSGQPTKIKQPSSPMRSASINVGGFRPPATPQPDYDAVQLRGNTNQHQLQQQQQQQQQQQRRTLRLGTVTIGEYGDQRAKRNTLRKMNSINGSSSNATTPTSPSASASSNGILKNGNRSSASFSSTRQPHTEKSIKFGN
ncbi:uncharacterized protein Dwil_GK15791 [Drosophila willistoni]|uniref:PDZ domain-containing protein n=1 Tax=Drosophila willistoni TaxID=7260 RepID=B4NQ89_DROWI|nr:uncharacterized protein Dwil_GK15791 [Drosophila willistoni]